MGRFHVHEENNRQVGYFKQYVSNTKTIIRYRMRRSAFSRALACWKQPVTALKDIGKGYIHVFMLKALF